MIRPNVGGIDRILRAGFGAIAIYIAFLDNDILTDPFAQWALGIFGIIFLTTSMIRFCPLYNAIRFSTCKTDNN